MNNYRIYIQSLLLSKDYNLQFLGDLLMLINIKESNEVELAGITAENKKLYLLINKQNFNTLNFEQKKYVLCHEILHLVLDHINRSKELNKIINHNIINIAADLATNSLLGKPPLPGCYPGEEPFEKLPKNKSMEYYIKELIKNNKQKNFKGFDSHENWSKISDLAEAEVKNLINQAKQLKEKYKGKLAGYLEEALEIERKIINWKYRIKSWITNNLGDKFVETRTKMNKRFPDLIGIVPGKRREPEGKIFIFIDTSGSITTEDLQQFMSVALSIPAEKEIYMIDAEIQGKPIKARSKSIINQVKAKGRGGTDFRPAFKLAKEKRAKLIVFFTDTEGTFPENDPEIKTLWITNREEASVPFGDLININEIYK